MVAFCAGTLGAQARVEFVYPSPNSAYAPSQPASALLQDAGSGDPESGGCGCVRTNGTQYHEGIDIKPVQARDRQGEPTDPVFAAMEGIVRYVNPTPGESSYGRYVVIEHPGATPAVYTLYAHLARVAPGIQAGARVTAGQSLGTMGHSSGGYSIPKDRSHVHFEIGLWVTKDFQAWYNKQKFGSKNDHGIWNGMNLMGIDPLEFIRDYRARRVDDFQEFISGLDTAARVRIATTRTPDFALRYPSLVTKEIPLGVAGWEIRFSWTGLPIALTPLTASEVTGLTRNKPVITDVNAEIEKRYQCKSLAVKRGKTWTVGKDLQTVLAQMFGL